MKKVSQRSNFEFRSDAKINDSPIIHINLGIDPETGRPLVAKGVVAIGTVAFGVVSIGAVAFGVVTLAGFGVGVVSLAGIAIGIIAIGAIAMGYEFALGMLSLDFDYAAWWLLSAAFIALIIWGLGKIKPDRL